MSCPFAARIQPFSDNTIVRGSTLANSSSLNALASSRTANGERRASPCCSATALSSRLMSVLSRASLPNVFSSVSRSAASSSCSPRIFISSSLARLRSFKSKIASACTSVIANVSIKIGFGLSSSRMMRMTSSIFKKAIK